jgi:hypothetical protein
MTLNINRAHLIADYAQQIVDGMDMDAVCSLAYDTLVGNLSAYSDEKLIEEVRKYSPELLEDS